MHKHSWRHRAEKLYKSDCWEMKSSLVTSDCLTATYDICALWNYIMLLHWLLWYELLYIYIYLSCFWNIRHINCIQRSRTRLFNYKSYFHHIETRRFRNKIFSLSAILLHFDNSSFLLFIIIQIPQF